jgi:hypothetical protein
MAAELDENLSITNQRPTPLLPSILFYFLQSDHSANEVLIISTYIGHLKKFYELKRLDWGFLHVN